jgi:putative PIN family toxin of toxin-antitoxin system
MSRIIEGQDMLFTSEKILAETASVLTRPKFKVTQQAVEHLINSIREIAILVPYLGIIKGVCRDSDDDKILECSLLGKADYIVTGDDDLLALKTFQGINIITAGEYLKHLLF